MVVGKMLRQAPVCLSLQDTEKEWYKICWIWNFRRYCLVSNTCTIILWPLEQNPSPVLYDSNLEKKTTALPTRPGIHWHMYFSRRRRL